MSEKNSKKVRVCKQCQQSMYSTAEELKTHCSKECEKKVSK